MTVPRVSVLTVISLLFFLPTGVAAQSSPCLSAPDTVAIHIQAVTLIVTSGDSTRLVQQGIPYRPAQGVTLVTDSLICQAVVNAYNGPEPSPTDSTNIQRAYVMRVGTTAYAMVGDKAPFLYVFFDSTYQWLAGMAGLH